MCKYCLLSMISAYTNDYQLTTLYTINNQIPHQYTVSWELPSKPYLCPLKNYIQQWIQIINIQWLKG